MPIVSNLPEFSIAEYLPAERSDAANNREAILVQARKMLEERTIQDIKMTELAKRSGVGQGTLYRRFENKHALAKALIMDDLLQLDTELRLRNYNTRTAVELLIWFTRKMVRFTSSQSELIAAIIMKDNMPAQWWLDTPVIHWIKGLFAALYKAAAPQHNAIEFAQNIIPVIIFLGPLPEEQDIQAAEERMERFIKAMMSARP